MIFVKHGQSNADSPPPDEKYFTDAEALNVIDPDPAIDPSTGQHKLVRQLKNRHVSMIRYVTFLATVSLILYQTTWQYWRGYWNWLFVFRGFSSRFINSHIYQVSFWVQQTSFAVVVQLVSLHRFISLKNITSWRHVLSQDCSWDTVLLVPYAIV